MRMNITHTICNKVATGGRKMLSAVASLAAACLLSAGVTACADMHDPELHEYGTLVIDTPYPQILDLDIMWQINWQVDWQYQWDEELLGPIGYTEPTSAHMDFFRNRTSGRQYQGYENFVGRRCRLNFDFGNYNLLIYNNDFENIRVNNNSEWTVVTASTEANVRAPEKIGGYYVHDMPDQLFSDSINANITNRLSDYTWDEETQTYVLHLQSNLVPRVFIYLIQVELRNNHGRVTGGGAMAVTGLSAGVNLYSGVNLQQTVAEQFTSYYQEQDKGGEEPLCLLGARMTTFGLCGICPWTTRANNEQPTRLDIANQCIFNLHYSNGTDKLVTVDISNQMRKKLTGGVINIILDIDDYPMPETGEDTNGGFDADVNDWQGDENHYIDI